MRHLRVLSLLLPALALALLLTFGSGESTATEPVEVETGLDVDTTGNAALSLGSHETCAEVAAVGETLQVDAVVRGVPPFDPEGLPDYNQWTYPGGAGGVQFTLYYDPAIVKLVDLDAALMLTAEPPSTPISFSDPLPDADGEFLVAEVDLSGNAEDGEGVLVRLTFEAVGEGATILDITPADEFEPIVAGNTGYSYDLTYLADAEVMVGGACTQGQLDNDSDSFADGTELYLVTQPLSGCPQTAISDDELFDAWPPDFDDDSTVDIEDVLSFADVILEPAGASPEALRHDLVPSTFVDTEDVMRVGDFILDSCGP